MLLVVVLAALHHVRGTEYFISPRGSDSNAGTSPQHPWRTAANANLLHLQRGRRKLHSLLGRKSLEYSI